MRTNIPGAMTAVEINKIISRKSSKTFDNNPNSRVLFRCDKFQAIIPKTASDAKMIL
jgi:hypothetical protein